MSLFKNFEKNSQEFGPLMQEIISFNRYKTIVEIGVAHGTTTLYLCNGCKNFGGKVYGFDLWEIHGKWNQFPTISSKEEVNNYLISKGINNFDLYKQNTKEINFDNILNNIGKIDFAFIDGDHSYDGVKNDFDKIYNRISSNGMIVFHDTLIIDGCREFILDLRSKYNDGTFDIIEFPFGNLDYRVGISILMKRIHLDCSILISEKCGSPSSFDEIYNKENLWYNSQKK
jgi:hypothetical protein